MQALVYLGNRQVSLLDKDIPKPDFNQVVIKVSRAAICGTDVHKFCAPPNDIERINGEIAIAGHEPSGWVYAMGEGAKGLEIGQRVLVAGVFGCNTCFQCRSGYNTACLNGVSGLHWNNHGGNAEFIVVPIENALPIPDELSFDVATVLTCAGGTAMTIVKETQLPPGQKLAIVGLGSVGLSLLIIAKNMGVKVIGVDVSAKKMALAQELGIDAVVNANITNSIQAIDEWSSGKGCQVVAECVGKAKTQQQSIEIAANRGKIAFAGLGDEPMEKNVFNRIIGNGGLTLIGIAATPIKYLLELITLTAEHNLRFDKIISHHFTMDKAAEALTIMESGTAGKIIFDVADSY